jgi:hypothetical protein
MLSQIQWNTVADDVEETDISAGVPQGTRNHALLLR